MAKRAGFLTLLGLLGCSLFFAKSDGAPAKPANLSVATQTTSADHGIIATLTWSMSPSSSQVKYYVQYRLVKKQHHTQKMARTTKARIFLKPNSLYVVKVMAFDANNPSLQGPWSDELKVQTGDSVPTHAPLNVTATAVTSTSILVRWGPIPQEYRNGKLVGYVVFYRQHSYRRWKKKMLKNKYQDHLKNLPMGVNYVVAVAGYTKMGVGKKSDSVIVKRPRPATTARQETTTHPSTTEVTTPKYVDNHIPKPTTGDKLATYERSSQPKHVYEISQSTVVSPSLPNAQANKDLKEKKSSSVGLVFKFIIPAAIGGLIMVLLIICILWRQRKAKRKRHQGDESISLTPIEEQPKKKSRCAVTRGEGSIRYAPPPKSYNDAAPPSQDADPQDCDKPSDGPKLSVISECEPSSTQDEPIKAKRPYAEVMILPPVNDKVDERYVKRSDHKPVPSSPCKSTTSESGYENMQHLYECLDRIKKDDGSPLYMNIGTAVQNDEDGLYEEIPADRQDNDDEPAVQQPLLEKGDVSEQVKPEYV